ncbi:bestrophin-like domain [Kitasatospora sp. NPDC002543]
MEHVLAMTGIVVGLVVVAVGALLLNGRRRRRSASGEEARDGTADYLTMMVGVLYALVLGVALVTVWESKDDASTNISAEAGALHQMYLLADALPPDTAQQARSATEAYAAYVRNEEWPLMEQGKPLGPRGWALLRDVQNAWTSFEPATNVQQQVDQVAFAQLSAAYQARHGREEAAGQGMSGVMWFGLLAGGALTLGLMFLFGVERTGTHLVLATGFTCLIVFMVVLIYELNSPFGGLLGLSSAPFAGVAVGV